MLTIAVITVSDRAFRGEYQDLSGPAIHKIIQDTNEDIDVSLTIVPDDKKAIRETLLANLEKDYIFTTGGTGISSSDITPDVTREVCDREVPGISEFIRSESCKETKNAVLSRGFCGIKGTCIIVNFPGSVKAAEFCINLLLPILEHGKKMIHGGKH